MKKVIFFDIDGTLIDSSCGLPISTVRAIRRARGNGHICCICTGRPYGLIHDPVIDIGFDGAVCGSGCYVRLGDEILFEKYIPSQTVKNFTELLKSMNIPFLYETYSKAYSTGEMARLNNLFDKEKRDNDKANEWFERYEKFVFTDNIAEYDYSIPVSKICFKASTEELESVIKLTPTELILNTHSGEYLGKLHTEAISSGFDKGFGVSMILKRLAMSKEDSIGFGDSMNDIDFMKNVGLSVAMGNAVAHLKDLCYNVCEPVREDGIEKELQRQGII